MGSGGGKQPVVKQEANVDFSRRQGLVAEEIAAGLCFCFFREETYCRQLLETRGLSNISTDGRQLNCRRKSHSAPRAFTGPTSDFVGDFQTWDRYEYSTAVGRRK